MEDTKTSWMELIVIMLALFIGSIPFVGVVLGFFNLFYWWLMLPFCFLPPMFYFIKKKPRTFPCRTEYVVLGIIVVALLLFSSGLFSQPWLEDGDPYGYAVVSQMMSDQHSFIKNPELYVENYAEPDAPGFSLLISSFYQITGVMNETMKSLALLILCLGLLTFFYFSKEWFGKDVALLSTIILFAIPCFSTRFIFANLFGIMLFFPALYFIHKKEWVFAGLMISGILLTHYLSGLVFGIFFIIYLLVYRKKHVFLAGLVGVLLSLPFFIRALIVYGLEGIKTQLGLGAGTSGTADKLWTLKDFLIPGGMINVMTGFGIVLFFIILIGFVYCIYRVWKNDTWNRKQLIITLLWFVTCLTGVLSVYLPFTFFAFRWWLFLAIPASLISGWLLFQINNVKKYGTIIMLILLILILLSSAKPKIELNMAVWGPSASLQQPGLLDCHMEMKHSLPANTKVFSFHSANKLQGFNMWKCEWCYYEKNWHVNDSINDIHTYLSSEGYEYLLVNRWYVDKFGLNVTNNLLDQLVNADDKFIFYYSNEGCNIWRLK